MPIDLDHNATTRPAPEVVAAVTRAMVDCWHNPSSVHRGGQEARHAVELARGQLAALIGAPAKQLTLTSGGTEAIDLAIRGTLGVSTKRVVVSTGVEHAAVRDLLEALEKAGAITRRLLALDREGVVDVSRLDECLGDDVALVSVQWANNETGAIQPVGAIGRRCREVGAVFHCDATQWVGKEGIEGSREQGIKGSRDQGEMRSSASLAPSSLDPLIPSPATLDPFSLLTFSPHKFHGPKGVGVLWARPGVRLRPTILGTQELGRRGGTENVPGIVGAGVAAELARAWLSDPSRRGRGAALRDRLERGVLSRVPGSVVNGPRDPARRLWNTTNIAFGRLSAEALLLAMSERGLYASAGAACSSGSLDPSPVLLAMGVPAELAHGSVRFSLSRDSTEREIDEAIGIIAAAAQRVGASR